MSHRSKWNQMFSLLREMRANIIAPVDTIGCASLADKYEDEKVTLFESKILISRPSDSKYLFRYYCHLKPRTKSLQLQLSV